MQLFFSTILEIKESFKSNYPANYKIEEYLSFIENKLQNTENASLGFFKSESKHETIQEKLMNIFLENKKEISPDDLKALSEYIDTEYKNKQIQRKALYQAIISVVVLGISVFFMLNPDQELKKFGFSTIGIVIGFWIK